MENALKNIAIFGGAGFIGTNLSKKLLLQGDYVTCFDNFLTGSEENIDRLSSFKNFGFSFHDIIEPVNKEADFDVIYNLACPASPPAYQKYPIETMLTCVQGSKNLADFALKSNAVLVHASTSEVYGDPTVHPQTESYWGNVNPNGTRSCYDEGKRSAETLLLDFKRQCGLDVRIARIFNTYGPFMDANDGRVVSNFINQALKGEDLTMFGDGEQTRSLCYVSDLVEGLIELAKPGHSMDGPINLGNPAEITINELAQIILVKTNSSSKIRKLPLPQDDPRIRCPSIEKAKILLGWSPTIELNEGLSSTIDYYKSALEN